MAILEARKAKKRKKFSHNIKRQFYSNMLYILQDLITDNGQSAIAFPKKGSQNTTKRIGWRIIEPGS